MKTDQALHLIVIDDSSNDAETLSNVLRNTGHAVRATRVEDAEDLEKALESHCWDMVVAKPALPYLTAKEAMDILRERELDLPLLVMADGAAPERLMEALQAGARDEVFLSDPARLEHAVVRELTDLHHRRDCRESRLRLTEANARAQALVDSSRDAIAYVHEGMHIYANDSYLQMFGYEEFAELEGMPLMNLVQPEDHGAFKEFLRAFGKQHESGNLDVEAVKADLSSFKVTMEFSPTSYEGEPCTQIIIRDQSISKELEKRLDDLSKQDLLTGLYNRQYFLDALKQALDQGSRRGCVLFIEPDRFRQQLREEIGIAASDLLIADLARVLKDHIVVPGAVLARFDGYTFTVLLPPLPEGQTEKLARYLIKTVETHVADLGGHTITVTCSVGVAFFAQGAPAFQELLARADKARRNAAENGGNALHVYNPAAEEMAERERNSVWAKKIKLALRDNSFYLVYQPVVSLHGDPNENYEIYLRLTDEGKEVNPIDFITVAEQTGLIIAIDRWVLHNAVKGLLERRRAGKATNFFINLSEPSLKDPQLLPWLRELVKAARLPANSLTVEVAESIARTNLKTVSTLFEELKKVGVRTALDHFGGGTTPVTLSINLLRHIQVDFLKLDGSLMANLPKMQEQQARIKQLSAAAREIKSATVAEFVEDAATLASLWSLGVNYIQGYFLQHPLRELTYDFNQDG